ncbi:MAG TPA: RES family NAD+ phosphorylase [Candidatus Binataceae bacterium]|nr:RES family NAD+ phosphorylase [Candidatus Binataceae bacterium]
MTSTNDIYDLKKKKLGHCCVGEEYLRNEIQSSGKYGKCAYCHKVGPSYEVGEFAKRIDKVFNEHYRRTSDEPTALQYIMLTDKESDFEWLRDGEPVVEAIMNAAQVPEAAAADIQKILEDQYDDFDDRTMGIETAFSSESYYEEKAVSDAEWQQDWSSFEQSLKTEARFFSRTAATLLASIFKGIDTMRSHDGQSLIVDAGPGTELSSLYRARAFQSDSNLIDALCRPDQRLGTPPPRRGSAGRMNALGISVFYGANDPRVALAEVRPPVGSQVAVARFEVIRSLRLLDLNALGKVHSKGSIFDAEWTARLERDMFLRSLSERITKPVMPDDEVFEYLPTQAIADFLATEADVPLDGIIFPSVQAEGLNVVLFHKASRVDVLEVPEGTTITAELGRWCDDGWERDYSVIEQVPEGSAPCADDTNGGSHTLAKPVAMPRDLSDIYDWRQLALKIDINSVKIHIVRKVEFHTDEHSVKRFRREKTSPHF